MGGGLPVAPTDNEAEESEIGALSDITALAQVEAGEFLIDGILDTDFTYASDTLTIIKSGTYSVSMKEGVPTTTTSHIEVASGVTATVTINDLSIETLVSPIRLIGTANLTLVLNGDNTLTCKAASSNVGVAQSGIYVPAGTNVSPSDDAVLTIREGDTGAKKITVNGGYAAAGIGGTYMLNSSYDYLINGCGTVNIYSGTVVANAGQGGAGIGTYNSSGFGGNIHIYGGTVKAYGSSSGAGIGDSGTGGSSAYRANIEISGGTVVAESGTYYPPAAIGAAYSNVTISGTANVTAKGGSGAGIGGNNSNVTITGGDITATANTDGAAIGGTSGSGAGLNASVRSEIITITGGVVDARNTRTSGTNGAAIGGFRGEAGGTITIGGTAQVTAVNSSYGAAIGGGGFGNAYFPAGNGGTIIINGGHVIAQSKYAAAIGGGGGNGGTASGLRHAGTGGNITISGGIVEANSEFGAGIGGGNGQEATTYYPSGGAGGTINISGGTVTANSSGSSAGIGGGSGAAGSASDGVGGSVTVSNGTVVASSTNGVGIGGGPRGNSGSLAFSNNAFVIATGGVGVSDIGNGKDSITNGSIKITGGSVYPTKGLVAPQPTNNGQTPGVANSVYPVYALAGYPGGSYPGGKQIDISESPMSSSKTTSATTVSESVDSAFPIADISAILWAPGSASGKHYSGITIDSPTNKQRYSVDVKVLDLTNGDALFSSLEGANLKNNIIGILDYYVDFVEEDDPDTILNTIPVRIFTDSTQSVETINTDRVIEEPNLGLQQTGYDLSWHEKIDSALSNTAWEFKDSEHSGVAVEKDTILYAKQTAKVYTVSFDASLGNPSVNPANRSVTYDAAYGSLPSFADSVYPGHILEGWYTVDDVKVNSSDKYNPLVPDAHTLHAKWEIGKYTVKFNAGGGAGTMANKTIEYDTSFTIPANAFTRDHYSFNGWASSDVSISGNSFTMPGKTVTLTATWKANDYIVTFLDFNDVELAKQTVAYGNKAIAPSNPSREGYSFSGWDKSFKNITSNLTVKAQYDLNHYTVNFLDHDGTLIDTQVIGHGSGATAPANPARDGYTFTGWDNEFANITGDLNITAQYELVQVVGGGTTNPPRRPDVTPDPQNPPIAPEVVNEPKEPEAAAPVDNVTDSTTNVQSQPLYTGISDSGVEKLEAQTGNIITDLANGNVPLGGFAATGVWSLLNMILAIVCAVAAFMLGYGAISKRTYTIPSQIIRLIAIASSVITVVVWVILDQLHAPTAWIDGHTPVILGLFALTAAITVAFNIEKRSAKEKTPELA
ncbi:MAG: InlB B-repeat-containing protein [Clostridiales Family XIII bacterium]|jgi:uncharacterized repeat protein (TIGR02543 family)|nr:InlB B-repeat-containing protein [Clostridiales Family XIII bacterium]